LKSIGYFSQNARKKAKYPVKMFKKSKNIPIFYVIIDQNTPLFYANIIFLGQVFCPIHSCYTYLDLSKVCI